MDLLENWRELIRLAITGRGRSAFGLASEMSNFFREHE